MSITINHEPVVWSAHGSFLSEGHRYGVRKPMKTYVIEFCDKKTCGCLLRAHKYLYEYLFSKRDCLDREISADKSLF